LPKSKGLGLKMFLQAAPRFESRKQIVVWRVFGVNIEKEIRKQEELMKQVMERQNENRVHN